MLNEIIICGRLCHDPELKKTRSDAACCTMSLAVDRDYKKADSQERETDFFDVVCWRQAAEFAVKYHRKGDLILAKGQMQSRKYVDKNGNNRKVWELVCDKTYFAERAAVKTERTTDQAQREYRPSIFSDAPESPGFTDLDDDGEFPF